MNKYNPQEIEPKWQKIWEEKGFYRAEDFSDRSKSYILIEFPYPSGQGLHVGHARSYSALDAIARKKRMEGRNVLFPIGWDAFGLPAENYAIKMGVHPKETTAENIANYKRQLKSLGLSFDWSREINTTDPKYYKWTQWIFLKLFEKGLAYQAEMPVNWCPSCKIGLANEEVVGGNCERCGSQVEKKTLKQWMLKITAYADRLIEDLEKVDFPEKVKLQQINWIGKSYGTEIDFKVEDLDEVIRVFTTRADTLFGVTAVVLAPENPLAEKLIKADYRAAAEKYISEAKRKSDFERTKTEKEKTGVFTGSYCLNPANSEKVPIWIGDYVVASYGGGAVMVVPAHDKRDYDFAKKYSLQMKEVVSGGDISKDAFVDYGVLVNSGEFNGLSSEEAIKKIGESLERKALGRKTIQYKLRDWVFSRQHYWGEPIPVIHCKKCGQVPVPEKDLPVELPFVERYQPTGTGESPLAAISEWVNVKCPKCQGPAKRETDTMPNWAGSNWYFMRYLDPQNDKALASKDKLGYWLPVDWYNGGFEHVTLHLLYSRFIYKFLYDIGTAPSLEPYQKRTCHGIVLAEDNRKMSKSFGNVINPDDIVREYGADTLRLYEMFMGPFDQAIAWSTNGMKGCYRFLEKTWKLVSGLGSSRESGQEIVNALHRLNKKVDEDLEDAKFNTIIAAFMEFVNFCQGSEEKVGRDVAERFLVLLSPFAPHATEELWQELGHKESISQQEWPKAEAKFLKEESVTLIIQINGRVRDRVAVRADMLEKEAKELAISREKVKNWISSKKIKKVIFVPGRLINIVI
jgi:leucyl-tRNA synthetase